MSDSRSEPGFRFSVLGPVRAWNGRTELNLGPRQQRQVLGLLLVRAGRDVPVHHLTDMLWGHAAPASAANSLHRFVGTLRRILEPGLPARAEGRWLLRRAGSYRFAPQQARLDLLDFRRLADEARDAERLGLPETAVRLYTEALTQAHGRCADDGSPEGRRYAAFDTVDEEYAAVARDAARTAVGFERVGTLLQAVRRAAELNPLDEALHAGLMLLLAADGRQADAFQVFQNVRDDLARLLGVDPGPGLRAAYDEVLQPRQRTDTRPSITPAQLPRDLPQFVGREADLDRADALLRAAERAGAMPIVAIDGLPGVGKSTFALHWAHRVAARFPDGQLYLDLRTCDRQAVSAAEALVVMLSALGVPPHAVPSTVVARAALFRSHIAGRRMLVVLDNADGVEQIRALLPGAAECLVVISGRTRMSGLTASDGAELITLGLPPAAEARAILARRMAAAGGDPRAAAPPVEVLETIVEAAGRLPLALAAIATELPVRDVEQLAAGLRRPAPGLDAFGDGVAATLRAAFDISLRDLPPEDVRLLRLLTMHAGHDLAPDAAASLTAMPLPRLRTALARLGRAQLLDVLPAQRIRLHPLVRMRLRELSDEVDGPDEQRAARLRLLLHYRHTAYVANGFLLPLLEPIPPGEVPAGVVVGEIADFEGAMAWFQAEQDVVHELIEWSADLGRGPVVWQLVTTMMTYFQRSGLIRAWLHLVTGALAVVERDGDLAGQAHVRRCLAGALYHLGDKSAARTHLRWAQQTFGELGMLVEQAHAHINMGVALGYSLSADPIGGDAYRAAKAEFATARRLYLRAGYRKGIASAYEGIAECQAALGQYQPAAHLFERALAIYLELSDQSSVASCMLGLGNLWRRAGNLVLAAEYVRRSIELNRVVGNRSEEAAALVTLGDVLSAADSPEAPDHWRAALAILDGLRLPAAVRVRNRLSVRQPASRRAAEPSAG
ncbi:AfsR/SARP family transcriptional regulator [Actinoplanes solisilvae]|uniref:AfsR/SARP family transcriptional regulator n=1 Tax=Actinoplanes solisilvae TaxID=2486853 RepID=UPI000FD9676A|nr:BTAD domain-containing putative transcriptional regulator [Actinoplanes solisilvae]